jgi:hypothetical protein
MSTRGFGSVRKLPSNKCQARYTEPDSRAYTARKDDGRALTFDSETAASGYLRRVSAEIQAGTWTRPDRVRARPVTFAD